MSISKPRVFLPTAILVALLLTLALPVAAQNRAIKGVVTDQEGKPIADAQITIEGTDIARTLTTKTNKKGEYLYILGLQVGTYRVVVRAEGYQPDYEEHVKPNMGEEAEVDFKLTPGKDYKLPFEMTDEEKKKYIEQYEKQQKRMKFSAAVKTHFNSGIGLADQGMYEAALEEFKQAFDLDPEQPAVLARMADAYAHLDKNEEAVEYYRKAIALDPKDANLLTNLGVVLSKMGKTDESQEAFKKAAALNPDAAAKNYYNLGVTLVNNGNTAGGAEAFKQAIAADPKYAEAYYQLGMALSGSQDTIPAAIDALKKYIEIGGKPDQVDVAKQIIAALEK